MEFHINGSLRCAPLATHETACASERRGSGFARPLALPPWGEAAKPLRGGHKYRDSPNMRLVLENNSSIRLSCRLGSASSSRESVA